MSTPTQPRMDDLVIGPGGQTFGQLKQAVLDSRAELLKAMFRGQADASLMEQHQSNVDMLHAAYTRVGLPYVAP